MQQKLKRETTSLHTKMSLQHISKKQKLHHKTAMCVHQTEETCDMCINVTPPNMILHLDSREETSSDSGNKGEIKIEIVEMEIESVSVSGDSDNDDKLTEYESAKELETHENLSAVIECFDSVVTGGKQLPYNISNCDKIPSNVDEYEIIMKENSKDIIGTLHPRYLCPFCTLNYYIKQNLCHHAQTVHKINNTDFNQMQIRHELSWLCNICDSHYMINSENLYTDHFLEHHNVEAALLRLQNEDKAPNLKFTKQVVPKYRKEYLMKCPHCTATFVHKVKCKHHILQVHEIKLQEKLSRFVCYFCWQCKENVIKLIHKSFSQCRCNATYKGKLNAKKQKHKQKERRMKQCFLCCKFFKDLEKHRKKLHPEILNFQDFTCDTCSTSYCSQVKLSQHISYCIPNIGHISNAPVFIFPKFNIKPDLKVTKIFLGIFKCPSCSTKFYSEKCCHEHILVSHTNVHLSPVFSYLTLYYCTLCAILHDTLVEHKLHLVHSRSHIKKLGQTKDLESVKSHVWSIVTAKFANVQDTRELEESGINSIKAVVDTTSVSVLVGRTAQNMPHSLLEQRQCCQKCKLVCASTAAFDWHVSTLHNSQLAFNYIMELTKEEISIGFKKVENYLNPLIKREVISNKDQKNLNHFDRFETAVYICLECCEEFGEKSNFVSHVNKFHSLVDSFRYIKQLKSLLRCQKCGFPCNSMTQCTEHSLKCKSQVDKNMLMFDACVFISSCCHSDFNSINDLHQHKCNFHHQGGNCVKIARYYKCSKCQFVFNLQYLYRQHVCCSKRKNSDCLNHDQICINNQLLKGSTIYKDTLFQDYRLCSVYAAFEVIVSQKDRKVHSFSEIESDAFTCSLCGLHFILELHLLAHVRHSHPDTKCFLVDGMSSVPSFKCSWCNGVVFSEDQCKKHRKTCLACIQYEKNIDFCHSCKIKFPSYDKYVNHFKYGHTNKLQQMMLQMNITYGCFLCPQIFTSLGKLEIHTKECVVNPQKLIPNINEHCTNNTNLTPTVKELTPKRHIAKSNPNLAANLNKCTSNHKSAASISAERVKRKPSVIRKYLPACKSTLITTDGEITSNTIESRNTNVRSERDDKICVSSKADTFNCTLDTALTTDTVSACDSAALQPDIHMRETAQPTMNSQELSCKKCNLPFKSTLLLKAHENLCNKMSNNLSKNTHIKYYRKSKEIMSKIKDNVAENEKIVKDLDKFELLQHYTSVLLLRFNCPVCEETYPEEKQAISHITSCHPSVTSAMLGRKLAHMYQCKKCCKLVSKSLEEHSASHIATNLTSSHDDITQYYTGIRVLMYNCPGCKQTYTKKSELQQHVILSHTNVDTSKLETQLKDMYKCKICNKFVSTSLQEHSATHFDTLAYTKFKKLAYACVYCNKCFLMSTMYNTHLYLNHNKTPMKCNTKMFFANVYVCKLCNPIGEKFLVEDMFISHMQSHNIKINKEYLVSSNIITEKEGEIEAKKLDISLQEKNTDKLEWYLCPICKQNFSSDSLCISHIKDSHSAAQSTQPRTNSTTQPSTSKTLVVSPKETSAAKPLCVRTNKIAHHCKLCPAKFLHFGQNINHFKKIHPQTENISRCSELKVCSMYQCNVCSQSETLFFSLSMLVNHMQSHGKRLQVKAEKILQQLTLPTWNDSSTCDFENHECELCHAKFKSSEEMTKHSLGIKKLSFLKVDRTMYHCQICDNVYAFLFLYLAHIRRKHESDSIKKVITKNFNVFECNICFGNANRRYKYHKDINGLTRHLNMIHGLVLNVQCEYACPFLCATPAADRLEHEDFRFLRRYLCSECPMHFHTHNLCALHVRRHCKLAHIKPQSLYGCKDCNQDFLSIQDLLIHEKQHKQPQTRARTLQIEKQACIITVQTEQHVKNTQDHPIVITVATEQSNIQHAERVEEPLVITLPSEQQVIDEGEHPIGITLPTEPSDIQCAKRGEHSAVITLPVEQSIKQMVETDKQYVGITNKKEKQALADTEEHPVLIPAQSQIHRTQVFTCNVCQAVFILKASCLEHLESQHGILGSDRESKIGSKSTYLMLCKMCSSKEEKFWFDTSSLTKHIRLTHSKKGKTNEKKTRRKHSNKTCAFESDMNQAQAQCDQQNLEVNNYAMNIKIENAMLPTSSMTSINTNPLDSIDIKEEVLNEPINLQIVDVKSIEHSEFDSQLIKEEVVDEPMIEEQNFKSEWTDFKMDPLLFNDEKLNLCPVVVLHRLQFLPQKHKVGARKTKKHK